LGDAEYIIHAASQDLSGLRDCGLAPKGLFDTELAGRLLGFPRVALEVLTSELLGFRLKKEHSAADWSTRPLPSSWLRYAALDVELLIELRHALEAKLAAAGKLEWARQEFAYELSAPVAKQRPQPWRRTQGTGTLRNPVQLAVVKAMWEARDRLAQSRDTAPHRILHDSAIAAAAVALPRTVGQLSALPGFGGPVIKRRLAFWQHIIDDAVSLPTALQPTVKGPGTDGPPSPRSWEKRNPQAAARLASAKEVLNQISEQVTVPVENLLLPDTLKRICWEPPKPVTTNSVADALAKYNARPWQIELVSHPLASTFQSL
jgi:ribonuclease D